MLTNICVYVCIYILQKYSEDANQKRIQKLKALRDRANSNDSVKSNEDNNEHQVFDQFTYRSNTTTNRKSTKLNATYYKYTSFTNNNLKYTDIMTFRIFIDTDIYFMDKNYIFVGLRKSAVERILKDTQK